jgi:hypothetical protein
MKAEGYRNKI